MGDIQVHGQSDGEYGLSRVLKEGVRGERGDVGVLASVDGEGKVKERICVLVYHYHDDDLRGLGADVRLEVGVGERMDWSGVCGVRHYRIDEEHSNAFTVWKGMGRPKNPTAEEYAVLEAAGELAVFEERALAVKDGRVCVEFELMRQGVSLLIFEGV